MKRIASITLALLLALPMFTFAQSATEIIKKAEDRLKGQSSKAEMTITIVRPKWTREMKMKTWSKGSDKGLILVTSPARDKGVTYLRIDKEVWNWVPAIERNIKLPPSMMNQSWMGTDFTNDDLVEQSSTINDYEHSVEGTETVAGRECYKIKLIPKPGTDVLWGKILMWIDKTEYMQLKIESYDEDMILVTRMIASDIRMLGGKMLPTKMEMIPVEKKGQKTVMTYQNIEFDQPIDDSFFSVANMKKVK